MKLLALAAATTFAALVLTPTQTLAQALPMPVHWYRGDGNANDSVGAVHGIERNGASYAPGLSGEAFLLDGIDDYIELPSAAAPTGSFTFEAWLQYSALGSLHHNLIVTNLDYSGFGWQVGKTQGTHLFYALTATSGGNPLALSTTQASVGPWFHVVVTFADWTTSLGTITTYVDGVPEGTATVAPSLNPGIGVLIGRGLQAIFYEGLIDEVRLYDYALSATDVARLYQAGAGAPPGCEFEWLATPGPGVDDTAYAAAALPGGGAVVGGDFLQAGGQPASRIAAFDGTSWSTLGNGMDGAVRALATRASGNVIAGGAFTTAGTATVRNVAEWDGTNWQALGAAVGDGQVTELAILPNGNVIAGGSFSQIGGVAASRIAQWDGSAWSAMTPAPSGDIGAIIALPDGDVLAAGLGVADGVRRWDGSTWQSYATPLNGPIYCMTEMANGDLVVGGNFTGAPSQAGLTLNRIARWNGSSWQALGTGMPFLAVYALENLSGVEVVAAGEFTIAGGTAVSSIARWDGAAWSDIDGGLRGPGLFQQCHDLATLANADLLAVGGFARAGFVPLDVNFVAIADVRCSPSVVATTPTCVSSGGLCRLYAVSLPKAGTTFERFATGLPAPSLVFGLTSIVPASGPVPLFAYGPSPVGCDLLVNPVVVELISLTGGSVAWNLALPGGFAFIGMPLRQQVLAIGLNAQGHLAELAGTNLLTARIGGF